MTTFSVSNRQSIVLFVNCSSQLSHCKVSFLAFVRLILRVYHLTYFKP